MNVALISLKESDYWQSCHYATLGLRTAYKRAFGKNIHEFQLTNYAGYAAIKKIAEDIAALQCKRIIFLDSSPLFGRLLSAISDLKFSEEIRFHVFGDVVRRSPEWLSNVSYLKNLKVEWALASKRQERLIKELLPDSMAITWVCPFPIFTSEFLFSVSLRKKMRIKLKCKKSDFVVLYTGRMSLQKNVVALVKAFSILPKHIQKRVKIVFAGDFDDFGAPFSGISLSAGGFFSLWQKQLAELSPALRRQIIVLPGVSRDELRSLYSAADLFCSLSLQHDEDFGMTPVEASISGLPSLLTSWGGYADMISSGAPVKLVPVVLTDIGPSFDISSVASRLADFVAANAPRKAAAAKIIDGFDVNSIVRLLKRRESLPENDTLFSHFDIKMEKLSELYDPSVGAVIFSELGENSVYEQIYRNYCDEK